MGYYYNTEDETYYTTYNETDGYTNPVTGIYAHLASAEIDEIPARINTLTLGQVLDKDIEETKGVIRALYKYNIEQLSNKETINGIYIWQIMDYTQTEDGDYTYDNNGNVELVTGIMKAFAGKTIGEIADSSIISQLKVFEVLGYYENEGKYYTSYDVETETYSGEVEGAIKALAGMAIKDLNDNDKGINSISLGEILNIDSSATGVIKALKDYKLGELESKINELQIYQIMGYYENEGKYYANYDEETETYTGEVTGIMGAIAGSSINSIGGTIDGLTAVKVLGSDCKLLNLINEDKRDTILITELSTELTSAMTNATIQQLVDSEIITEIDTTKEAYDDIKDKTITDVINMILGE
jgi:hypothetical protein